jgi:5-methylcytosine-specific restriction endonuclease McrA
MARNKSQPFSEYPEWTEARFLAFIRSALRKASNRWPPKYEALENARRPSQTDNKRQRWEYLCAACRKWHAGKDVSVDHIEPAGSLRVFEDIAPFAQRLFVRSEKLQILCERCHTIKTAQDREEAKRKAAIPQENVLKKRRNK